MTTREHGANNSLTLKHKRCMYLAFAHPDLKIYLERGRQALKNVVKGLKFSFCQTALTYTLLFHSRLKVDSGLTAFTSVTFDDVFQNQSWTKWCGTGVTNSGPGAGMLPGPPRASGMCPGCSINLSVPQFLVQTMESVRESLVGIKGISMCKLPGITTST